MGSKIELKLGRKKDNFVLVYVGHHNQVIALLIFFQFFLRSIYIFARWSIYSIFKTFMCVPYTIEQTFVTFIEPSSFFFLPVFLSVCFALSLSYRVCVLFCHHMCYSRYKQYAQKLCWSGDDAERDFSMVPIFGNTINFLLFPYFHICMHITHCRHCCCCCHCRCFPFFLYTC